MRIDPRAQALMALLRHSLRQNIAEPLEAEIRLDPGAAGATPLFAGRMTNRMDIYSRRAVG